MKKLRITALILALLMLAGTLASCKKDDDTDTDTDSGTVADDNSGDNGEDVGKDDENAVDIAVADAKGSTGLTGDFKAAFAAENGDENVITGAAQNSVPYSIYASLPSPTKITSLVLTAPSKDQDKMANATIDASVDGVNWVEIKALGSSITKGKVYTLAVNDSTEYLFVRVRQSDEHRTEDFRFRTVVIRGVAGQGSAGDLSKVTEEKDTSTLAVMKTTLGSNAGTGTQADAFLDNANSWTAKAGSNENYLIGTMQKKTEIRAVKVKVADGNTSVVGAVVQASADGQTWIDLYTVTADASQTYYINDATLYSYVRVLQVEGSKTAWTLNTVLIYGVAGTDDTEQIPAKYVASSSLSVSYNAAYSNIDIHSGTAESVWDLNDKGSTFTNKEHRDLTARVIYTVAGEFANGTVITQIKYYTPNSNGNRVRASYFEASVDGTTWEKIGTLPGTKDNYWVGGLVVTLNVDSNVQYKYIRIVQSETLYQYYWTLGTVEVIGVQYDADGNIIQPAGGDEPIDTSKATTQAVTYVSSGQSKSSGSDDESSVWDISNKSSKVTFGAGANYVSGSFATATTISQIKYYAPSSNATRSRGSTIQASVDGKNWVTIATLPSTIDDSQTYTVDVTNTNAYMYIKIIQREDLQAWSWSVGTVEVIGVASTANA